ncbi:MAG TPA: GDSL-type esterase/lipase family protein, partial [Thermoanaerobaculia bacterium]
MRKKLALSAASILITLLVAEIALRVLGIGAIGRGSPWFAGGSHPRFLFQADAASGYALRPGFRGEEIALSQEFKVPVAVDGQGLRAQPHTAPPQPRVLAIGDSMTFGEGVPADATWPAALERTLGVRVDNAGVPGYNSAQMAGRLRRYLPLLHSRVVVMLLSPTWDLGRCASPFVYKGGYIVGQGYVDRL